MRDRASDVMRIKSPVKADTLSERVDSPVRRLLKYSTSRGSVGLIAQRMTRRLQVGNWGILAPKVLILKGLRRIVNLLSLSGCPKTMHEVRETREKFAIYGSRWR